MEIIFVSDLSIGCYTNSSILVQDPNVGGFNYPRGSFSRSPGEVCWKHCKGQGSALTGVKVNFSPLFVLGIQL